MQRDPRKYLYDIKLAVGRLTSFSDQKSFEDYQDDEMLRSAVERQFEIIGEALSQLLKTDPGIARTITGYQRIIAFRNILIHGYAVVDNQVVWDVLQNQLPVLAKEVDELLAE